MKEEGQIYQKIASDFLSFAEGLSYDFQSLVMIFPRFSTLKDHNIRT